MGLLGSIGGIAGSLFGGPVGGAIGGLVGGALDGKPKSGQPGQGGSNAPAYVPIGQAAADKNFLYNKDVYQGTLQNQYNTVNPYNQQLLNNQFNNPFNTAGSDIAAWAQNQYLANAQQAQGAAPGAWNYANQQIGNANQQNALYQAGLGNVQNSVGGLYGLAGKSNATYDDLIKFSQAQKGNVQNSANNLYSGGNQVLQTALDPQNALRDRTQQQLTEQNRSGQYARGIQQTPYGAALENEANKNFAIDWQNQQLARQSQGLQSAQGAYGGALGLTNSYAQNISGLQTAQANNYGNLTNAAQNQYTNYLGNMAQSNLANTQNIGAAYQNANQTGAAAGQNLQNAFNSGYGNYQTILGNQQNALNNYQNTNSPYFAGLGNLNQQNLSYFGLGQQGQNQQFGQNAYNQQQNQNAIGSLAGVLGSSKNWDAFGDSKLGNWAWNALGGLGGSL